jgi:hypothetical protein
MDQVREIFEKNKEKHQLELNQQQKAGSGIQNI